LNPDRAVTDVPSGDEATAAARTLALLHAQADALRAELLVLRQDLAQVERHFSAARGAELLEANEHLVLATLRAQGIADSAKSSLGELARAALPDVADPAVTADQAQQLRDLREANEKLVLAVLSSQALEAQAQEAHQRQIKFLAMVAHELRNPLMPLTTAGQLLDRARLDEALLLKLQATINRQVAHMTRLVGDLLDGSRITTGKFRLERSVVEMRGVLLQAIDTCATAMETRGQRFTSELPPATLKVNGDSMRLVQVFGNLLDNASKYTPQGGAISLRAAQGAGALVITIADTGIGIGAQALSHVFDLFVQEARATVANRSGLGIGLAVVRELVEAHGGSVVAASRGSDLGSEFSVTLPLLAPV
jgi:signal transduction histidine kinase